MKDLISKIKTLDYKQFALRHGEKIGMGVVGLIVVMCLFLTTWASDYKGEPHELEAEAKKVADQIQRNAWGEDKRKEFIPYLLAVNELQTVTNELDAAAFDWTVPMSPKLYSKQEPADEPTWEPVSDLLAYYGTLPMAVEASPSTVDDSSREPETKSKPEKSKSEKKSKKDRDSGDDLPSASIGYGSAMGIMSGADASSEKARGVRYVVVLGVVDVKKQWQLLKTALHAESLSQVMDKLEYVELRIERQRAIPGPTPWIGPWRELSTDASVEILKEASELDLELVHPKHVSQVFTSPLPRRLDEEWDPNKMVHPRIPTLTEDEQTEQLAITKAAAKALADDDEPDEQLGGVSIRRGFARVQKDANQIRRQATSTDSGSKKMSSYMAEMMKSSGAGMATNSAGKNGPSSSNMADMMRRMGGPGAGMGGMGSGMGNMPGSGGEVLGGDLLMFRYFDFAIEPGECYRYRVRLIVVNPNFEEQFVSALTVAEEQFRETPWSAASPPVVVESDVDYALARIASSANKRTDGVDLKVVQFDPNLGTLLMDTFKVAFGAYVSAEKRKTMRLDVAVPSFKEESDVNFASKDVLIDGAGAPPRLASSFLADLNLREAEGKKIFKSGELDMAVTLNRFGEIVELDAGSKSDLKAAEKRVSEQREPYSDIKETIKDRKKGEEEDDAGGIFGDKSGKKGKKKKKRDRVNNPLKASSMSSMMMPSMPGMGSPAGLGSGKKAKAGSNSGSRGGVDRGR